MFWCLSVSATLWRCFWHGALMKFCQTHWTLLRFKQVYGFLLKMFVPEKFLNKKVQRHVISIRQDWTHWTSFRYCNICEAYFQLKASWVLLDLKGSLLGFYRFPLSYYLTAFFLIQLVQYSYTVIHKFSVTWQCLFMVVGKILPITVHGLTLKMVRSGSNKSILTNACLLELNTDSWRECYPN